MRRPSVFFAILFVFFLLAGAAAAQTITGAITGTVADASGAVVPNVRITATNTGTNLTHNAVSNESGLYNLQIGRASCRERV